MAADGRPNKAQRFFAGLFLDAARRRRLQSELAVLRIRLEERARVDQHAPWLLAAASCVTQIERAIEDRDLDRGWASLLAAERHEVDALSADELSARVEAVRREALSKLSDWRRDSVVAILAQCQQAAVKNNGARKKGPADEERAKSVRLKVKEALRVRDEHFFNVYRKTEIRRNLLLVTALILAAALFLTYAIAVDAPSGFLGSPDTLLIVMVFGMLGGLLSTAVSLADDKSSGRRMPEHIASTYVTLARPIFGAGFAVAVYIAIKSGAMNVFEGRSGGIALASFLAGFSERWFLGIVDRGMASKKES